MSRILVAFTAFLVACVASLFLGIAPKMPKQMTASDKVIFLPTQRRSFIKKR
jgi:hypothetical protein